VTSNLRIAQLVDGTMTEPAQELTSWLTDPNTGLALSLQRQTTLEHLDIALSAAEEAHRNDTWMALPGSERAALLLAFSAELAARVEELAAADSMDSGVPLTSTRLLAAAGADAMRSAADLVATEPERTPLDGLAGPAVQWRLPWGPAAVVVPWNAPAPTALFKTAAALAAGCPVILKPSEWAPHFAAPLAEAFVVSGMPTAMVQIVQGGASIGQAIAGDPRVQALSYTGGVAGGRAVAAACAPRMIPLDLELSGNNPVVILADVDIVETAAQIVGGMLLLNGQWCAGPRRAVVPESMADELIAAVLTQLEGVAIGPTTGPSTQLGPIAQAEHLKRLQGQLDECSSSGHTVRHVGTPPTGGGHFLAPAVISGDKTRELRDEIFGPVLVVQTYTDVDEAVEIANDHSYGLSGYVFGRDAAEAATVGRRLRAGTVSLNRIALMPVAEQGVTSMWGQSGLGSIGALDGVRFFTGARIVG
jgi:phenylacetaldehyde dehydrogenase